MQDRILEIIRAALDELNLNAKHDDKIPTDNILELGLYGDSGVFDSMHLVSFLTLVEDQIEEEFEVEIVLASERAMSRRVSPFSSVRRLVLFIEEELESISVTS